MMLPNRIRVLLAALILFASLSVVRPSKAHAVNEWVLAGIATGAYITAVVIATLIIYEGDPLVEERDLLKEVEQRRRPVNFGTNCGVQPDGNLALVCW